MSETGDRKPVLDDDAPAPERGCVVGMRLAFVAGQVAGWWMLLDKNGLFWGGLFVIAGFLAAGGGVEHGPPARHDPGAQGLTLRIPIKCMVYCTCAEGPMIVPHA